MGKQTDRINQMEAHLDSLIAANKQLISALETFKNAQDAYVALDEYYNSKLWRKDFDDDQNGKIPAEIKRGVLSEDGVYNALTDYKASCFDALEAMAMLLKKI